MARLEKVYKYRKSRGRLRVTDKQLFSKKEGAVKRKKRE